MKIESQTARVDFEEFLGDTLTLSFGYCDEVGTLINLTGYSISCIFATQALPNNVIFNANSSNGGIIVDAVPYNIIVKLSTTDTNIFIAGRYVYSVLITDPYGDVNTLINGLITFKDRSL